MDYSLALGFKTYITKIFSLFHFPTRISKYVLCSFNFEYDYSNFFMRDTFFAIHDSTTEF